MSEQPDGILVERGIKVRMRDGILLDAMIWRPAAPGRYPVLIERVAYELEWRARANGELYASHGYVVVAQNVRGVFDSEGEAVLMRTNGWGSLRDGYDTVEWAAVQPWSTGQIGMLDGSYSGITQYLVAPTRPPHLRALFVRQGSHDAFRNGLFRGGAHPLAFARSGVLENFLIPQLGRRPGLLSEESTRRRVEQAVAELEESLWRLPLTSWPLIEGLWDGYWANLAHPQDGPYWAHMRLSDVFSEIDTPILHLTSWYDILVGGPLSAFAGIRAHGRTASCRESQRLVVGPWIHGPANVGQRDVGALDFGPEAVWDLHAERLRWYDHWLHGVENGAMDGPTVRLFLMGTNRWLGLSDWPPAEVSYRPLHLAVGPEPGPGRLTFDPPAANDAPSSFVYDPAEPVPSLVSGVQTGPTDYRPIEDRVLVYESDLLTEDLHVVGPITAVIYGASSCRDTDWVVRLCDIWPDGRSLSVCDGILRARYRESFERQVSMEPGQVYRFEVDLRATAQTFQAGHRLRVHVTSSDFPRYDRNLNTGGPLYTETDWRVATNTVFHDAARPSHVLLPIMSSAAVEAALIPTPG